MPQFPLTNAYWPDGDPGLGQRRQWTYGELLADAERAAQALLRRFSPGERMAIWSGNSLILGHDDINTTMGYKKSQKLHPTGENLQVGW
jgi:acyl-CoA synthetase (AMP-forming)/AMP-acid ligase II